MAEHLQLDVSEFRRRYGARWDRGARSHVIHATRERPCPLLGPAERCTVHPVKPEQCRTFPFWPELLDSQEAWEAAREACEGIDHPEGKVFSRDDLQASRGTHEGTGA